MALLNQSLWFRLNQLEYFESCKKDKFVSLKVHEKRLYL